MVLGFENPVDKYKNKMNFSEISLTFIYKDRYWAIITFMKHVSIHYFLLASSNCKVLLRIFHYGASEHRACNLCCGIQFLHPNHSLLSAWGLMEKVRRNNLCWVNILTTLVRVPKRTNASCINLKTTSQLGLGTPRIENR